MAAKHKTKDGDVLVAVRIDTIGDNELIPFDLYTEESGRYYLFCRSDMKYQKKNLSPTYVKRTKFFYIKKEHQREYQKYLEDNLSSLIRKDDIPIESKVEAVYEVSHLLTQQLFVNRREVPQKRLNNFIINTMGFVFTKKVPLADVMRISEKSHFLYNHMLHCSVYAAAFFPFIGLKDPDKVKRVAIGAFLHDIGKSRIDSKLLNKGGILNQYERDEMQHHVIYGLTILRNEMRIHDPIIEAMVGGHHERLDGSGYPKKRKDLNIFERVMGIIDTFEIYTYKRSELGERSNAEAIKFMLSNESERLDKKLILQFAKMLEEKM